jgi:hypothetical protein
VASAVRLRPLQSSHFLPPGTNALKWAWSIYRHQALDQRSHVRTATTFEPVQVEPACIVNHIRGGAENVGITRQRAEKFARMLNLSVVHITYEQLQRDAAAVVRSLFKQVRLPFSEQEHAHTELHHTLVKAAPENLTHAISNLDELRGHPSLATPCLQAMFDARAGEEAPWPCRVVDAKGTNSTCFVKVERRRPSGPI